MNKHLLSEVGNVIHLNAMKEKRPKPRLVPSPWCRAQISIDMAIDQVPSDLVLARFGETLDQFPDLSEKWLELIAANHLPSTKVSHLYVKRPIHLFKDPVLLKRDGMFLRKVKDQKTGAEDVWRISEFACEERTHGYEWGVEGVDGFDRTYYRVRVQRISGTPIKSVQDELPEQEWWVYKDEILNKLMLHGVYASGVS